MFVGLDGNGVTASVPIDVLAPGSRMAWSPDGSRLAFAVPNKTSYHQIATAKLDGSDLTTVTSAGAGWDRDPDW